MNDFSGKTTYSLDSDIGDSEYLFLYSVLGTQEKYLLTKEQCISVLDEADFNKAVERLTQMSFPDMEDQSIAEVEHSLDSLRESIFSDCSRIFPDNSLLPILRLKYDYHNAKAIMKGEAAGVSSASILSKSGLIRPALLHDCYRTEDYTPFSSVFADALRKAREILAMSKDSGLADRILDKAYYSELLSYAQDTKLDTDFSYLLNGSESADFLYHYVRLLIDGVNLRTAVRCRRLHLKENFLKDSLIEGGLIRIESIASAASNDQGLKDLYASTPYSKALTVLEEGGSASLTAFEKSCDEGLLNYLSSFRCFYDTSAVPIWFFTALDLSVGNVRMILKGLKLGIDREVIKERLRDCYV